MSFKFTWLGHSSFLFDIDGHPVLVDPFLTDNPLAAAKPESLDAEMILLSHAHGDHTGDALNIGKRTGAKIISNFEIGNWFYAQGLDNIHQQNPGGGFNHGLFHAKWTVAFHSSSFPDGTYGGEPNGFILTLPDGARIYFAGDTALFSDMKLIGDHGIDMAFLPIGDNYTMGPEDALKAIEFIRPRLVVPMHYNTWDVIAVDVSSWANRVSSETSATPIVLDPGGAYTLS
jgi:L-ascorbate metabolism protein UlaG (beta-lactamase superfamily)